MKANLLKLANLQENFKLGNLSYNLSAWDIRDMVDEENILTISYILQAIENDFICDVKIGDYKLDYLTEEEKNILRICDEKLSIETQYRKAGDIGGGVMLLVISHKGVVVKVFSYNSHEHSEGTLFEEDISKVIKKTINIYDFEKGYKTHLD